MVTVDVVVFLSKKKREEVLLVQRAQEPFQSAWALPGGFVGIKETLLDAARRELAEETGLQDVHLEQLRTYGEPDRDPRGRVISVVFCAVLPAEMEPKVQAGSDAENAGWFPTDDLPNLAFDHNQIIADAITWFNSHSNPDQDN
jgi:8-oxo-dGTP diphosphatase